MDKVVAFKNHRFLGQVIEKGKEYEIRKVDGIDIDLGGVYVNNEWFCDVESPLYFELFTPSESPEDNMVQIIKQVCERLLECELAENNEWSTNDIENLKKIVEKDFKIEFK